MGGLLVLIFISSRRFVLQWNYLFFVFEKPILSWHGDSGVYNDLFMLALHSQPESDGSCGVTSSSFLGDGGCDIYDTYNTDACNWDGGDCCASSCVSSDHTCGGRGYTCLDPTAATTTTTTSAAATCNVFNPSYIGDSYCDAMFPGYNTADCNWDGGDCCTETCSGSNCGNWGFTCLDELQASYNVCDGDDSASLSCCWACLLLSVCQNR